MWESYKCECGREFAVKQGDDPIENPACVECGSDNTDSIGIALGAKETKALTEIIARNLTAWETSKDKRLGLLPEVYLSDKVWYKKLTGEEFSFSKAVKKFNIE